MKTTTTQAKKNRHTAGINGQTLNGAFVRRGIAANKKRVHVRLPRVLSEAIKQRCGELEMTASEFAERAIRNGLKGAARREQQDKFFLAESLRHARSLPLTECARFLRGLLFTIGDAGEGIEVLRQEVIRLQDVEVRLDLIQMGEYVRAALA